MSHPKVVATVVSCLLVVCSSQSAFSEELENAGKRRFTVSDVNQGRQFLNAICSRCHGRNGKGGKGPDLTDAEFIHAETDEELIDIIANGVTGTGMIGFGEGFDDYYWPIVAYIRDEQKKQKEAKRPPNGNIAKGYKLFKENNCTSCHWVGSEGGRLGTNLTGLTATANYIRQSIRDPNSQIDGTHQRIHLVDKNGRAIVGRRLDENSYSILLMDDQEKLHVVDKKDSGNAIARPPLSLMPDFKGKLSDKDIEDITTYLYSLRKRRAK